MLHIFPGLLCLCEHEARDFLVANSGQCNPNNPTVPVLFKKPVSPFSLAPLNSVLPLLNTISNNTLEYIASIY